MQCENGGRYALRLSQESTSTSLRGGKDWVAYELDLIQHLRAHSLPVVEVIQTKTGESSFHYQNRIGTISKFCEGEHLCALYMPREIWQTRAIGTE